MKTTSCLTRRAFIASTAIMAAAVSLQAAEKPRKLLVVTITTGFRHSSIPTAEKILERIGKESGVFTVDFVRQPEGEVREPRRPREDATEEQKKRYEEELAAYRAAKPAWDAKVAAALQKLSPASLRNYDGVIFANTTGDLPLPDLEGFLQWIESGKAFIGMHSATDTFRGHKPVHPYVRMIGGEFRTHGPQVQVDCLNDDAQHAACKHLPSSWTVFDEIYLLNNYEQNTVHNLLSLDKHPNDKTPGHFPIAWCKNYGKGRVFYTSLGHREDMWDDDPAMNGRKNTPEVSKAYQKHILEGIKWALGLAPGDATPQVSK
jgi:uncharacterized protein